MKIGQLNRRITIKTTTPTVIDEAGGVSNGQVVPVFTTYAEVTPKNSAWLQLQGIQVLGNTYEIILRYSDQRTVNTTNIIEYEGKDLIVKSYTEVAEGRKRFLKILAYEQTLGGATTPLIPPDCAGMQNFTDVILDEENSVLVFSGGNLLGTTHGTINAFGVPLEFTMDPGQDTLNWTLTNVGTYPVKWHKECGTLSTAEVQQSVSVSQEPNRYLRLFDIRELDFTVYKVINFPVYVYSVVMSGLIEVSKTNTGLIANDEQEFMDIWNADPNNSLIGQLASFQYEEVLYNGQMINTCYFYLEINPNIHTPLFAWCEPVE